MKKEIKKFSSKVALVLSFSLLVSNVAFGQYEDVHIHGEGCACI